VLLEILVVTARVAATMLREEDAVDGVRYGLAAPRPVFSSQVSRPPLTRIDDPALGCWVAKVLRVAWWPSVECDALGEVEKRVWRKLNPALNLSGMSKTPVRSRISQLRRGLYNELDPGAEDG